MQNNSIILDAIKDAQSRSRLATIANMFLAFAVFLACWNAYFSWNRYLVISWKDAHKDEATADLREMLQQEWMKSRTISLSPLGIQIGVHDIAPIGGAIMLTGAIWHLLVIRREHVVIREAVRSGNDPENVRIAVYHYSLFLDDVDTSRVSKLSHFAFRKLKELVCYAPFFAASFAFLVDILCVFLKDPFDVNEDRMIKHILSDGGLTFWLVTFWLFTIALLVFNFLCCRHTLGILRKTEQEASKLNYDVGSAG